MSFMLVSDMQTHIINFAYYIIVISRFQPFFIQIR